MSGDPTRSGVVEATLPADAACLVVLRRIVRSAARRAVPGNRVEDVAIAATEAFTNAVLHAYPVGRPGAIHLAVRERGGCLCVCVQDGGVGFTAGDRAPTTGLGLGLQLIEMLADTVRWTTGPSGTAIEMCFRRAAGASRGLRACRDGYPRRQEATAVAEPSVGGAQ